MGCLSVITLNAVIQDCSTGAISAYVVAPVDGTVVTVYSVLGGTIGASDNTLTVNDGDGNSMGTITITQNGGVAGDLDSLTPAANNDVVAGEIIEIATNAASTTARQIDITVVLIAD